MKPALPWGNFSPLNSFSSLLSFPLCSLRFNLFWIPLFSAFFLTAFQTTLPTILITEFEYKTNGDDETAEWVELYNISGQEIELSNYKLGDEETAGDNEGFMRFPDGAIFPAGEVLVIARTAAGFRALYGFNPTYEMNESDPAVPNMRHFPLLAGGDFALRNDGDEILLYNEQNKIVDGVNYGDSVYLFRPSLPLVNRGQSLERQPAGCDTDSAAEWLVQANPNPGTVTLTGECTAPVPPGQGETFPTIGQVQGVGDEGATLRQTVTVRGIVTTIHEDQNSRGIVYYTIYLQDPVGDNNPQTSEGIAVYVGREKPAVQVGDELLVTGQLTEYYGLTEFEEDGLLIEIISSGNPLPQPVELAFPLETDRPAAESQAETYEVWEGMWVQIDAAVVVGATFDGCGLAVARQDVGLTRQVRHSAETDISFITPVLYSSDVDCSTMPQVKAGDLIEGLQGVLTYNFEQFKIILSPETELTITPAAFPPLPQPSVLTPEQFSLTSFNVENLFDTIDDTGDDAEPKLTEAQLHLKLTKISYAIATHLGCPTLVGMIEVENRVLLEQLATYLEEDCGFLYAVSHLESADGRGIDNALLTDPRRVQVQNAQLHQTCTAVTTAVAEFDDCPAGQDYLFSRPPFEVALTIDGVPLQVYVNHFKSKSGGEQETNAERLAQAHFMHELAQEQLAQNPAALLVVMGDFNDYADSPALQRMTNSGALTNVLRLIQPAEAQYSYNFGGVSQLIDGVLVSPALLPLLAQVQMVHVNTDFPDSYLWDVSPEGLPYKSSDHDPSLVVFALPAVEEAEETPPAAATLPPTSVPATPNPESNTTGFNCFLGNVWLLVAAVGLVVSQRRTNWK